MIFTITECKFKRLNKKKSELESEKAKYNDTNDPQQSMRKILDARIKKLDIKISSVERKMRKY